MLRRVLEPGEEVERFAEVAGVVQAACDCRQVGHRLGDVAGSFLEDGAPFVLRHRPPGIGFADRDQRGARRLGTSQRRRDAVEPLQLLRDRVTCVAHDAAQPPGTFRGVSRFICQRQMHCGGQRFAGNGSEALDAPVAALACSKCDSKGLGHEPHWVQDARRYDGNTVALPDGTADGNSRNRDGPRTARRT